MVQITRPASTTAFPGQWFQLESGLHYNWHRHYDPTTGRYVQPDPLGMIDEPSRWAYAGNSPLMEIDPEGLQLRLLGPAPKWSPLPVFPWSPQLPPIPPLEPPDPQALTYCPGFGLLGLFLPDILESVRPRDFGPWIREQQNGAAAMASILIGHEIKHTLSNKGQEVEVVMIIV